MHQKLSLKNVGLGGLVVTKWYPRIEKLRDSVSPAHITVDLFPWYISSPWYHMFQHGQNSRVISKRNPVQLWLHFPINILVSHGYLGVSINGGTPEPTLRTWGDELGGYTTHGQTHMKKRKIVGGSLLSPWCTIVPEVFFHKHIGW